MLMLLATMATYVGMGRMLMAGIDQYQTEIESKLSEIIKLPVKIDKLTGSFHHFDPILEVHGLTIGHQAQSVIGADFIRIHLDAISSLGQGALSIEDINLAGLYLNLVRDESGAWGIAGLPWPRAGMNRSWDFLARVGSIRLAETNIGIKTGSADYTLHSDKQLAFEFIRHDDMTQLSLVMQWIDNNHMAGHEELRLAGTYSGDPRQEDFSASLYLKLPAIDLADFLPAPVDKLETLTVDGQYWLTADKGEIFLRGSSTIHALGLTANARSLLISDDINISLGLAHVYNKGTSIQLNSISGHWLSETFDIQGIVAAVAPGEKGQLKLGLRLPDGALEPLSRILIHTGRKIAAIDRVMANRLQKLAITGEIIGPRLFVDFNQKTPYYEFMSEVRGLHLNPSGGIPGVSGLDGFVVVRPQAGYFDVHTEQPFTVKYDALFAEPWPISRGNFRMHYIRSDSGWQIFSDIIEASYGKAEARGKFTLNLHQDTTKHSWGLEIGAKNADVLYAHRFLPYKVPDGLRDWIQHSILAGTAIEAGLVFHGPLGKETPSAQKVFEIYAKVKDVTFAYDPRWPRLDDLDGTLYIGNKEIYADVTGGRVFDSKILSAEARVPISAMGVDTILVNGRIKGRVSDGLRLFSETPLHTATNQLFEDWQGDGEMQGRVRLKIPFGKRNLLAPWADVNVSLTDARVFMPDYNLSVEHLTGEFKYESDRGLHAPQFTASLFNQPVSGRINTVGSPADGAINVQVDGRVQISDLQAWSGQSLLRQLAGIMPYSAHLQIPQGKRLTEPVFVEVRSALEGVAINLPSPMKKDSEQKQNLTYHQSFMDYGHKIALQLDGKVAASVKTMDGLLTGGRVHFGATPMGVTTYDKLRVSGQFENLVYAEWKDLIRSLDDKPATSLEADLVAKLASIDIKAARLDVGGAILKDGELEITRSDSAWNISIHNEILDGMVMAPDDHSIPLDVRLNYLHLSSDQEIDDPLGAMEPADLAAFRFNVDRVLLDEEDYGQWSFAYSPQAHGGLLNIESATIHGLTIAKDAKIRWQYKNGVHSSAFEGDFFVSDVADSLERWGFAPSIQGHKFDFLANISWPGSPAMIDLMAAKGLIELRGGQGKFVQAKANLTTLKLIGIFDFASLRRRLRLDFSDVIDKGFVFNEMRGSVRLNQGIVDVADPIYVEGSGSIFKLGGRIDFVNGVLDNDVIVTLPVSRNLPWYAAYSAYTAGPLTGVAIMLAQKIFRNQIDAISSAKYKISGGISEPEIKFVSIFNDSVRAASVELENLLGE